MWHFVFSEALTLAFNTQLIGQSAKAALVNRSQRLSQRIQRSVAQAFLRCQHKLFWLIIHKCMTSESLQQPLLAVDTLLSDETKQRLKMSLVATGSTRLPGHCMQAPHVFVSERYLTLHLADGQALHMPYVTLPVPMISTSAGALHSVLLALGGIGTHPVFAYGINALAAISDILKITKALAHSHGWVVQSVFDCLMLSSTLGG